MILADGGAIDQILPVGIGGTESGIGIGGLTPLVLNKLTELIAIEHVDGLLLPAQRHAAVVRNFHATLMAFLRGDDDDTV